MNEQIPLMPPDPSTRAEPQQPSQGRRLPWFLAICSVAVVAAAGGYVAGSTTSDESTAASEAEVSPVVDPPSSTTAPTTTIQPSTPIEDAAEVCDVDDLVSDAGETIVFDTEGQEEFQGDSYADVACVLQALAIPTRVMSAMDSTRALDGTLEDSWDGFSARWNFHPDSGMSLTIWIAE